MIAALLALLVLPLQDTPPAPLQLSLDECLQLAMVNNLSIAGAKLDAEASVADFGAAWGAFDTIFLASASYSDGTTAPTPSNFVGGVDVGSSPATRRKLTQWSTGFSGLFETGTSWTFDIGPRQSETNSGAGTSEVFTGAWSFDVTQPLLRGGGDYSRSALVLAQQDAEISSLAAESTASATLEAVTTAYWNFVFARQSRATAEESVRLATELLDITRRKFEQGLQNRLEVTQVEAELATRREELLSAENAERQAEDDLRRLVLAPGDTATWNRPLLPVTQPNAGTPAQLDEEAAIDIALRERPDVIQQRRSVDRADVALERARNQSDPRLDLSGGYGINANQTSYSSVYTHLKDTSFDEAHVSLTFELPLSNRAAGYAERRAELDRQHAGVRLRETEMNAVAAVRSAVRGVELQLQRVAATSETTRLQREVYEGERRRLENDLSTPFQVRQMQRDLLTAIDNETRARLDLEVSRVALLASQGLLLSTYGFARSLPELSLDEAPPAP